MGYNRCYMDTVGCYGDVMCIMQMLWRCYGGIMGVSLGFYEVIWECYRVL